MQEQLYGASNGVAVWQAGGSINTRGESRSAEAEYRKCTGRRTETELGWSGGWDESATQDKVLYPL